MRITVLFYLLPMLGILTVGRTEDLSKSVPTNSGMAIVVQNYYFARPGKVEEVYRWRLHASEVRVQLGLASGRVLKRTPAVGSASASDLPDVIWECEYPDTAARTADVERLSASREFEGVETHMNTLIRRFSRAIFSVASGS